MAHSPRLTLSERGVCRKGAGLRCNQTCSGHALGGQHQQHYCGLADSRKWTFLQKLLAIEDAHDKRRMASDRASKGSTVGTEGEKWAVVSSSPVADSHSRWIHGQILDDEEPEGNQSSYDDHKFPPVYTTRRSGNYYPHAPSLDDSRVVNLPRIHQSSSVHSISSSFPNTTSVISVVPSHVDDDQLSSRRRKRQLRLPPILLPRVYTITPRPLQCREFLTPTKIRGPITDAEWEDLKDCRYIRQALPRFSLQVSPSNVTSFQS